MANWTLPAWAQALIDLLLLVLPGGSMARQVVVVVDDLIPVAIEVRDWVVSPEGQRIVGNLGVLAKRAGVEFDANGMIQSAHEWEPGEMVGGRPSGANRGGLMLPGV